MNSLGKTLLSLFSLLIVAVVGIMLYVYWPAITGTINNNQYLTPEQGQELYDLGYQDGCQSEEELTAQLNYYQTLTDDYYIQVNTLNSEISALNAEITSKTATITELTNVKNQNLSTISSLNSTIQTNTATINGLNGQIVELTNEIASLEDEIDDMEDEKTSLESTITSLRSQITTLNTTISNKEGDISDLTSQIQSLNDEIDSLENDLSNMDSDKVLLQNTIVSLNNQIATLNILKTQLEQINTSNQSTITTLNNQIVALNTQIGNLNNQILNNSGSVSSLNLRISELEDSIAYYEDFIATLETSTNVVATFEYDGGVYNIQVIQKGSIASVTNPSSTTYKIFNGWKVNGASVNLSNYVINANTTFTADVTYKYDVVFKVDNTNYSSSIITKGNYATLPTNPTKTGYAFDGWTTNGVDIVNVSTNAITSNTTYIAKFTKLHTVTFMYENTTVDTQTVRNGNYATSPTVNNTTYKVFNGWKLNGVAVDLDIYPITNDTTFVADIIYKYDVDFKVDNTTYDTQIIIEGNYAVLPLNPTKNGYVFDGWSLNGTDIVNVSTTTITQDTEFVAKFTKLHTVTFKYENTVVSTQSVRNGNYATSPSVNDTTYKVFNGWLLNNNSVNISSCQINSDTTFIASITYKYDVVFKVDSTTYSTQIVTSGSYATTPTIPTKNGYTFNGWTTDGNTVVNLSNVAIVQNTTFYAKFILSSGLFQNGVLVKSWDQLIDDYDLKVVNNAVKDFNKNLTGDLIVPVGITKVFDSCFRDSKLNSVSLPEGLTEIAYQGFYRSSITRIDLPDTLLTLGNESFASMKNLKEFICPESVNLVLGRVFINSTGLEKLVLPRMTSLSDYFIYGCSSLKDIYLPDTITTISKYAFNECSSLRNIYIPASVTTIKCSYDDGDLDSFPFDDCSGDLVVYCEVSSKPAGWDKNWNVYDYYTEDKLTVYWGYTYEQYIAEIGED